MGKRKLGRVFVTGADGFIGSWLTESLLEAGHEVTALCIYNSLGHHGWLTPLGEKKTPGLNLLLGDIRDGEFLRKSISGHQTVFHLASLIAIPYSYAAPRSYVETNVNGALNVAQACLEGQVERLIHTSTSEVYGTAIQVPIAETHPLQGQSPYSASKIGADMMVESFQRSFGLPAITLRPFNTYGPRQSMRAVIPTLMAQMLSGQHEIKLGNVKPTRDFNYVMDTVAAFRALGESDDSKLIGHTFNTGSGREISIGDLATLMGRLLDRNVKIVTDDVRLRPEKSEVDRLLCDSSKLIAATGWRPETDLEKGLLHLKAWMERQPASARAGEYHT